ncbi:uncharacterized protein PHACADRAFT_32453 [Phanerochaete carnosa HHB-10118-sp]|uniref:Uncharacterized protein n=1 Tax=Phanerochaete carnosa (strain HHB-10118-sp) TaxID=650164 RepID=K5VUD9_PHACS|nr:uncharacterized protein PHACADRAFT_32453 [Phanerochaete carnosa HHB-10118-sp]EKM50400.1 hypothetical protein PHACADRAFT_32453 [Phanerochaete carnosa HHB-10118-sp]
MSSTTLETQIFGVCPADDDISDLMLVDALSAHKLEPKANISVATLDSHALLFQPILLWPPTLQAAHNNLLVARDDNNDRTWAQAQPNTFISHISATVPLLRTMKFAPEANDLPFPMSKKLLPLLQLAMVDTGASTPDSMPGLEPNSPSSKPTEFISSSHKDNSPEIITELEAQMCFCKSVK